MIRCQQLSKTYGDHQALKAIDFHVEGKGCHVFLGVNGAGKTTTMGILTGLVHASSGSASILGLDCLRERQKVAQKVGYLPQEPAFYAGMTAWQWMTWTGSLYHMDGKRIAEQSERLLRDFEIWEDRNRKIGGFSGGMKQRLGLAQALIHDPEVLILDEPVSALDPIGRHQVLKQIEAIKDRMTVFMSTHILEDAERVADRVIIIDKGQILLQTDIEAFRDQYAEPVIHFEIEGPDPSESLKTRDWVQHIQKDGRRFSVTVADQQQARRQLPKLLLDSGADLIAYQIAKPGLEELFLKVVKAP